MSRSSFANVSVDSSPSRIQRSVSASSSGVGSLTEEELAHVYAVLNPSGEEPRFDDALIAANLNHVEEKMHRLNIDILMGYRDKAGDSEYEERLPTPLVKRRKPEDAAVEKILKESNQSIRTAALKLVAPTAVNVRDQQYHNLLRLSFDENAVAAKESEKMNESRRKANQAVLRNRR